MTKMDELPLAGAKVLVVEDEPFVALELIEAVEIAGGIPVGPAVSIAEALSLIRSTEIQAGILDVNLPDGDIEPVINALSGKAALVVHTGVGLSPELQTKHRSVRVFGKPTSPDVLTAHLAETLRSSPKL